MDEAISRRESDTRSHWCGKNGRLAKSRRGGPCARPLVPRRASRPFYGNAHFDGRGKRRDAACCVLTQNMMGKDATSRVPTSWLEDCFAGDAAIGRAHGPPLHRASAQPKSTFSPYKSLLPPHKLRLHSPISLEKAPNSGSKLTRSLLESGNSLLEPPNFPNKLVNSSEELTNSPTGSTFNSAHSTARAPSTASPRIHLRQSNRPRCRRPREM